MAVAGVQLRGANTLAWGWLVCVKYPPSQAVLLHNLEERHKALSTLDKEER